jgi:cell division protein FtsB
VSLPYTLEFFNEKLSLPVEFFNPLRRVGIGPGVDAARLPSEAHSLGECTGAALHLLLGDCPLEIGLKAPSLERAEADQRRRPFLAAAAAALVAALGVGGLYYDRAAQRVATLNEETAGQAATLEGHKAELDQLASERRQLMEEASDLAAAPALRTAWAAVVNELGSKLPARNIWLTRLRPVVGGQPLEPSDKGGAAWAGAEKTSGSEGDGEKGSAVAEVSALMLDGLYLENDNGPAVVDEFVEALAGSPVFGINPENKADVVQLRATQSGEAWAYDFKLLLPLARPIPL